MTMKGEQFESLQDIGQGSHHNGATKDTLKGGILELLAKWQECGIIVFRVRGNILRISGNVSFTVTM